MIDYIPRILIVLVWFLLGPLHVHGLPQIFAPLMIIVTLFALASGVFLKRSFRGKSITLLGVLLLMFFQTLQLIVMGVRFELTHSDIVSVGLRHFFSIFFDINLGLAIIGVVAASGVAVYLEFGKTRLPLTSLFPEYRFLEGPAQIQRTVKRLATMAGVPTPQVSLIDSGIPWAFVTRSRKGFVLAVSVGLLETLQPAEIQACLAHEISHLKNKDFTLRLFATFAKVGLFTHPLSYLIEPAIYRAREHLADRTASSLVGGSDSLVSALSKIREAHYEISAPSSVGVACLFCTRGYRWFGIFDKQPTLDARIKALKADTA